MLPASNTLITQGKGRGGGVGKYSEERNSEPSWRKAKKSGCSKGQKKKKK